MEWLGGGLFSQTDYSKHGAMRQTLNPAFRMDYLKQLDSFFVSSADQLASISTQAATAASSSNGNTSSKAGSAASAAGAAVDMQRLFRLMTLDTIGLTSMKHDFAALQSWQQQQQPRHSGGAAGQHSQAVDVEQLLSDLNAAFLWQSLMLPLPRSWLPGWKAYVTACKQLDRIIQVILAGRRATRSGISSNASSSHRQASGSSVSSNATAVQQKQDLVGYLLQAQQQQGTDAITDTMIGDEIKTMMFGSLDTSSFTLAMLAYHLALHPDVTEQAAAEVQHALQGRDAAQLGADDVAKMPLVTACVNETLRLTPAGPYITRTAAQDAEVAGYHIPKGLTLVCQLYAMHQHPDIWPQAHKWLPSRWMPEGLAAGLGPTAKNAFVPFSIGARSCIGRNYAMLQMVLTAAVLLGRGIGFGPVAGKTAPKLTKGLTLYSKNGIWLQPLLG